MRIAIAGAGIAGLTAALALARRGAAVDLFDPAAALSEAGAGVQLSPNATRVLRDLDLLEPILATAVRPAGTRIRRAWDGADLATLPFDAAAARYGAPFLVMHRADLQAVLLAAVRAAPGVTLTTGTGFAACAPDRDGVVVTTDTGRRIAADGLIGADGLHSRVRRYIAPEGPDPLRFSGRVAYRALVPAADAPPAARLPVSQLWLGAGAHLVHYPVRGGTLINLVAIVGDAPPPPTARREDWMAAGDADTVSRAFAAWAPEARALLAATPAWRSWPLYDCLPLPRWSRGAATLLGDAAHPMLPFLAQGAAQAIADAGALGEALAGGASFPKAAAAYERARKPTADRVQRESRRQAAVYHLARPASMARDLAFRVLGPARMLARYDWLYGVRQLSHR